MDEQGNVNVSTIVGPAVFYPDGEEPLTIFTGREDVVDVSAAREEKILFIAVRWI